MQGMVILRSPECYSIPHISLNGERIKGLR